MSFTIEKFENEPILLVSIQKDYEVAKHQEASDKAAIEILDASPEPLYHLIDLSHYKLSLNDIIAGANRGAKGAEASWHHPNIRLVIFVSPDPLVKAGVAGLASATFGRLNAKAFLTLEDALNWIRQQA